MNPAPPVTRYLINLSSRSSKYGSNCAQNDLKIHRQRTMLDVIKIVFELDSRLPHVGDVAIIDLRPASESGFYKQAGAVKRNLALKFSHQFRPLRARPYQAHLAAQHTPKLG